MLPHPAGQVPSWGQAPAPRAPTALLSDAAVVGCVSVLLFFLFLPALAALVLAVVGLVRIRRAGGAATGNGLAIIGGALAVLSLVGGALLVGVITESGLLTGHLTKYASLRAGDCFINPKGIVRAVNMFQVVDCSRAHDGEVVGRVTDPSSGDAPYPGTIALIAEGRQLCPAQVRAYTGGLLDTSRYAPRFYYPRQSNWDSGERTIVCVVGNVGGSTSGSVRSGATS